ncbi:hypothetical protein [Chitinophaga sp. S165]|uniref:hypothetical protein n=1 Tax=Chitinophaga sp. S165 TaxID=2135462 RepID=UPI000D95A409|nr:hypothetical protein [Chitinophaga sp. S165]PWV54314.1 hypothetical protein C7475_1021071 [Chitinophaga sp. S165]
MRSILRKQINLTILFVLLSAFTFKLYAQQYNNAIVKISQSPIDITTLAKTIAKQTGLEYSLNMQNASLKKHITLRTGNWQLSDILKQVQLQAGLNYRIIGDHILFMDYLAPVNKATISTKPRPTALPAKVITNPKANGNKVIEAEKVFLSADSNNATATVNVPLSKAQLLALLTVTEDQVIATDTVAKTDTARTFGMVKKPKLASHDIQTDTTGRSIILAKRNARLTSPEGKNITGGRSTNNRERSSWLPALYTIRTKYVTPKIPPPALFEGTDSAGNKKLPPKLTVPSLMKDIAIAKTKQKEKNNKQRLNRLISGIVNSNDDIKWYQPLVNAGINADEVLYLNASLTAGIKFIYGIISYGSAFPGGRLRWGAGIPVSLNDEQKLHFTFTTGSLKRRTNPDSLISYGVKETLTRYGAGWSKTVTPHIIFQAQLQYNVLKKTSDSTRAVIQNLTGDYGHFAYGKAPYLLSGSYSENGDFRRWIGLQISFFYKLF